MTTSGHPPANDPRYANFPFNFQPQANPFTRQDFVGPDHARALQNKGNPNLTARELLDLPLPHFEEPKTPGNPSPSSHKNIYFWSPDKLLWDQYEDMFPKDLGGYPHNVIHGKHPQPLFFPNNERPKGQKTDIEAQVVNVGRDYILTPVTDILLHKIIGLEYNVEGLITGRVPDGRFGKPRYEGLSGYVDAVWGTDADGPFAFCEFKRRGVLRDALWKMKGNQERGQDPNTSIYLKEDAKHVIQQVVKYAWCTNKLYFMLCDWDRFFFLRFPRELPLEAFTYYWRSGDIPPGVVIPNQRPAEKGKGRSGANITSPYPDGPIQAVMSTNRALFKMQVQAFVCHSYEHRNDARPPYEPREGQEEEEEEEEEDDGGGGGDGGKRLAIKSFPKNWGTKISGALSPRKKEDK